jgi:hypothetical protein
MVSFPQASPPTPCAHLSPLPSPLTLPYYFIYEFSVLRLEFLFLWARLIRLITVLRWTALLITAVITIYQLGSGPTRRPIVLGRATLSTGLKRQKRVIFTFRKHLNFKSFILGVFAQFLKRLLATSYLSVRLSVGIELGSNWTNLYKIWHLVILRKSCMKMQASLKSEKNKGCFKWRHVYIYDKCRRIFLTMRIVSNTFVEKIKTDILRFIIFFWNNLPFVI